MSRKRQTIEISNEWKQRVFEMAKVTKTRKAREGKKRINERFFKLERERADWQQV